MNTCDYHVSLKKKEKKKNTIYHFFFHFSFLLNLAGFMITRLYAMLVLVSKTHQLVRNLPDNDYKYLLLF